MLKPKTNTDQVSIVNLSQGGGATFLAVTYNPNSTNFSLEDYEPTAKKQKFTVALDNTFATFTTVNDSKDATSSDDSLISDSTIGAYGSDNNEWNLILVDP